ncbi:MAG TPA: chloride channel protein [Terrimicrobiaceae bacterium]|nr:chloride channel protein [Terrimicrobiaceae bacterium]
MSAPVSPARLLLLAVLAAGIGSGMAVVSAGLLKLIQLITAVAFYGRIGLAESPADNSLGPAVILVPVAGALIIGFLARYGSPAIRGHGIPEAMEQVLENASRIPARITFLKPLSAAISIGTGGPFGAEGPIIATGGAAGSLLGQILPVSASERKALLAAGAAAGMAATFGSPVSALLLAVELLLFEFNIRSLIPVAIAVSCATLLRTAWMGGAPVFAMPALSAPTIPAFAACLVVAAIMGAAAYVISRAVFFCEARFEALPLHWMWWPALGAMAVGCIGYLDPRTLGVGYSNITDNLSGSGALQAIAILTGLKFLSWCIALGSGTSGGTLAPLMTIGSGLGWMAGVLLQGAVPTVDPHLTALLGMACIFGAASQAMLASAVFAFETTGQSPALFVLLAGCAVSVWVFRALGKTSIMTEKIARRGISVPTGYSADIFAHTKVAAVMDRNPATVPSTMRLTELAGRVGRHDPALGHHPAYPILDAEGNLSGIVTRGDIFRALATAGGEETVRDCATTELACVSPSDSLRRALEILWSRQIGGLPVVHPNHPEKLIGYLSHRGILAAYDKNFHEELRQPGWFPPVVRGSGRRTKTR